MGVLNVLVLVTSEHADIAAMDVYMLQVIVKSLCELSVLSVQPNPLTSMHFVLGKDKADTHSMTFQFVNSIDPYACGLYSCNAIGGLPTSASLATIPSIDNSQ